MTQYIDTQDDTEEGGHMGGNDVELCIMGGNDVELAHEVVTVRYA
jgi:hypothetical protein